MFNIKLELPHILDFGISIDLSTFDFSSIDNKLQVLFMFMHLNIIHGR